MELIADFQSATVFSEIGVALAGFGMLGSVLTSRRGSAHPALDALRLRGLVNGSAALTFGGLLPLVISNLVLNSKSVWLHSSIIFVTILIFVVALGFKSAVEVKRLGALGSRRATITIMSIASISILILLVSIIVADEKLLKGLYLTALTSHATAGFLLFARVFSSLFRLTDTAND